MRKYQFYIAFNDKFNTAASKAIEDCRTILTRAGYEDYTVNVTKKGYKLYLLDIFKHLLRFLFTIKRGSVVAVQYPLLSGNSLFKYLIKTLRLRKVKFFCIVHDLDELRYKTHINAGVCKEALNLNQYDCVIVHNEIMRDWLLDRGISVPMLVLEVFDYLGDKNITKEILAQQSFKSIAFAGNLGKSHFIYQLGKLEDWSFNLYGPNFSKEKAETMKNVQWNGVLNSEDIVSKINGAFGLIWDGVSIQGLDENYGNYLKYNTSHKLSLYLAAGLPVIAPAQSAVSKFIKQHNLGILIESLEDLKNINIEKEEYLIKKRNALKIGKNILTGAYLSRCIRNVEIKLNKS